jgi:hypothetical protein
VVDAGPAAGGFHRSQPLLPHAVRLADVMDQAKIGGKITGPETLSELPGKRPSAPQMSVQGVAAFLLAASERLDTLSLLAELAFC